jgi:uncharacterized Zn finger protein (UPF0148 family)
MMSKYTSNKGFAKKYKPVIATVDSKHEEMLEEFHINETVRIPKLKQKRSQLKRNLKPKHGVCLQNLNKQQELKEAIRTITLTVNELEEKKRQYFLNCSNIIFDYFEEKKKIDNNEPTTNPLNLNGSSKNDLIKQFFKIKSTYENDTDNTQLNPLSETSNLTNTNDDPPDMFVRTHLGKRYTNITLEYLSNFGDKYIDLSQYTYSNTHCTVCGNTTLIQIEDEGKQFCPSCSVTTSYMIENEKPSYKDPPKEVGVYMYQRINHFKEIISQAQGKETTNIPVACLTAIKKQIKKERIVLSEVTNTEIRNILKKLDYTRYNDHIAFIKNKFGIKPPIIPASVEEKLFSLFTEVQPYYDNHCPSSRINFFSYAYTAYKLCEKLGETQYLPCFFLLKDDDKIMEQDCIWKKICNDLGWTFKYTITTP